MDAQEGLPVNEQVCSPDSKKSTSPITWHSSPQISPQVLASSLARSNEEEEDRAEGSFGSPSRNLPSKPSLETEYLRKQKPPLDASALCRSCQDMTLFWRHRYWHFTQKDNEINPICSGCEILVAARYHLNDKDRERWTTVKSCKEESTGSRFLVLQADSGHEAVLHAIEGQPY